jgi:hypothetical protein
MNEVCSATSLAHTLQFEHEHDDENEHDSSRTLQGGFRQDGPQRSFCMR